MKSRICFPFAAIIALVLTVAAAPCHATERRDPLIVPDAQHSQSAKGSHATHAKISRKKPATQKPNASSLTAEKSNAQGLNLPSEGKDQMASETSSGSSKSARTSAGK